MKHNTTTNLLLLSFVLGLTSCGGEDGSTRLQNSLGSGTAEAIARFSPSKSVLPSANVLVVASAGTIQSPTKTLTGIPNPNNSPVIKALQKLDGFSTILPVTTRLTGKVDKTTLIAGKTVRLFNLTNPAEIASNTYFLNASDRGNSETTLAIVPLKPFPAKSNIMVVLTNEMKDDNGTAYEADLVFDALRSTPTALVGSLAPLENLRRATAGRLVPTAKLFGIPNASITLLWTFPTQSVPDVLVAARKQLRAGAVPTSALVNTGATPITANIYAGSLAVPYYLQPGKPTPTDISSTVWQSAGGGVLTSLNPTPTVRATLTIPLLVTIPMSTIANKPANGWPVVIAQHGIRGNRTQMLAIAGALAGKGQAMVAIDLPLHGVISGNFFSPNIERTFEVDLINNTTSAPGADGVTDTSGAHYINLTSLLTSRDNLRQGVADLFALTYALSSMDYDGGGADFDTSKISFVGMSLGAITGVPFVALEPSITVAAFNVGGGGIGKILDGSIEFSPAIARGLSAAGLNRPSAAYESFINAAQWVVDSGDPVNYASQLKARGIPILWQDVVGATNTAGDYISKPDQVVPINVTASNPPINATNTQKAFLSGSEPTAKLLGAIITNKQTDANSRSRVWTRFNSGYHGSLLDHISNAAVTGEMQGQIASFLSSVGSLTITNTGVLAP